MIGGHLRPRNPWGGWEIFPFARFCKTIRTIKTLRGRVSHCCLRPFNDFLESNTPFNVRFLHSQKLFVPL